MKVKHNLPSVVEVGKEYPFKLEVVEEEPECPIPDDGLFIQAQGNPKVYFMQDGVARWVTTSQVLHDIAEDLGLDENQRTWVKAKCLDPSNSNAIPIGEKIEKWPEGNGENIITLRGFMNSGSGSLSRQELENGNINLVADKGVKPIPGIDVSANWGNMINQIKPSGYPKQVMMNGEGVGTICPYAGRDFFPGFAKEIFDGVRRNGVDLFIGDGSRYVQQKGSDGKSYEGGYCELCRAAGGYGFESSQEAIDFKNTVIEDVNRVFKDEAGSKKMGAFFWQGNLVNGQVVFAGMVGVGRPKVLGKILDFSVPMIYNSFEEFKVLAEAWRKEVSNNKLILALCWSASDCPLNYDLLVKKIEWCEANKFNWMTTGNNQKGEQLQAIKEAMGN